MSIINEIPKKVQEFASENASTLLTAGGVVGVVATGVLAGRAGFKAAQILDDEMRERVNETDETISTKEKVLLVGPHFIPPVAAGSAAIAAIIFANRISAKEAAALAAAYGLSQKQLEEYKAKVAEKLTGPKHQQIKDEIAQDQLDQNPASKQVIIIAGGDSLCLDAISGRYFRSSMEHIRRTENELNQQLYDSQMVGLSEYFVHLGLKPTEISDMLGWHAFEEGILELEVTTGRSDDQQPCLVITPSRTPEPDYNKKIPGGV